MAGEVGLRLLRWMDEPSARADKSINLAAAPAVAERVVAALNEQESHWFLANASVHMEQIAPSSFLDLARRGWRRTAAELEELNPEILLTCWSTPRLSERWLESEQCRLRYVCHLTGSVRHVVPRSFLERGGIVTNWGNIPSAAVAEQALLLALASLRSLPRWGEVFADSDASSDRMERLQVRTLLGRRVGIHGLGQVACALIRLIEPFGVSVMAYSEGVPSEMFVRAGARQASSLREVFAETEVVFECESLTDRTRNSVGPAELAALCNGGVFVNVARGGLVDENALLREANSGRLRVASDVFATEPLAPESPWLRTRGVVVSPHISGPTFDQYPECTHVALTNIERYLSRRPLRFMVTPEIYDRST